MTESKIERIIREVSFAAQCAEMALQGVKAAAYDSDLLSFPEVQDLSEVNYRLDTDRSCRVRGSGIAVLS